MKRFILAISILILSCSYAQAADIILITNNDNPVSSLSEKDVKQIFLGKKTSWDNGAAIHAFTQKDQQNTELFTQKYLKKSSQQFSMYWKKAIFTGKGTPLPEVTNDPDMKKIIAAQKGSLGYILDSELDNSVKRVEIR